MIPDTIGRYEIEKVLGEGGMARVFLAHDPYVKRKVAVKILSRQLTDDPLFHKHFQHEAEVIASLEHPCIVPIFDFGQQEDQPYIVMRYMSGQSLEERFKAGTLGHNRFSQILARVARALDAAHEKGIIHRDVKPSNILFEGKEEAYLSDFGLAKSIHRAVGSTGGFFVGTPEYMSPEQVQNLPIDGRSDIYSLGIILYLGLTGHLPHTNDSPLALALAHVTDSPPPVSSLKTSLSADWDEVVGKALAKDPADRYATASDLARDVRELANGRWYLRKLMED